ncbi:sarcosine oxidase subunit gamma family protein [Mesorhizobium sp. KR9-304]|uniref:sarcosine oxidase subunit gamma family protein n=1 Tax=Mesorhizobium sp. KR9-304 TaxID=3156614 RepID=UPI0032B41B42
MAEYRVAHHSVLTGRSAIASNDIVLAPLPEGHVFQLLSIAQRSQVPLPAADSCLYGAGPEQWYVVGDAPLTVQAQATYFAALPKGAYVIDQSHGRVRIRIEGRRVEQVLAKGTGVDLTLSQFPLGSATTTLFGHIAAHLIRKDTNLFELMILRGFAESLWDELVRMSVEST